MNSPLISMLAAPQRGLQPADYVVVLVYLLLVLGTGWYFSRQQRGGEDYFVAGRRMPWFVVGLSVLATLLSTISYLAAPGETIQHGLAFAVGSLAMPLAFLVVSFLWLPFYMRLRVPAAAGAAEAGAGEFPREERPLTSIYEYVELRFGATARWLAIGLFVFVLRLGWMALIVLTASRAVSQVTFDSARDLLGPELTPAGWTTIVLLSLGVLGTVYTALGGIKAVIWTDFIQFLVLFAGLILTLIFVAADTQTGPVEWWERTTTGGQTGHEFPPWGSWDLGVRNTVLFVALHGFFWYVCTFVADQVAVQRFFTTRSLGAAIRSNVVNFGAELSMTVLMALCGMALLTYYLQFPAEIAPEAAPGVTDPRHPHVADQIFPHFIAHGLPVGVSGLVVAALFAVSMSSLDSGVNSVATVLIVHVFRRRRPDMSGSDELRLARFLTLLIGLGCTAVAWPLIYLPADHNILAITARTFNCALGPLAAMFVTGMFLPHVGEKAVVISTVCGFVVALFIAWWVELLWLLGLSGYAELSEALAHVARPGPFLITPLAATATFVLAALLGALLRQPDLRRTERLTWRSVVFRGKDG